MKSKFSRGAAALAVAATALLWIGGEASAHHGRWHRHAWGHHGASYYPPFAYGPGFVYAPDYAAMLYEYAYYYRRRAW
jgi:hypothetical protein